MAVGPLTRIYPPFFLSSRRPHTRCLSDWSSDVCSSDLSSLKEFEQARNMLKGNHRQRDLRGAVDLLWTGVAKGYVPAEVTLADLYARGDGVSKSCTQERNGGVPGEAEELKADDTMACTD